MVQARHTMNDLLGMWAREFRLPLVKYFQKRAPATDDADDLVQEVFVRLAKRADLEDIDRVDGYVFRTAANVLADRFRKLARQPQLVESYKESCHGKVELTPERVLIDRQTLDLLVKGLYELPERTRQIFVLYHFENLRQTEIAEAFGMPISTVEKHMARANKQLLDCLGRLD